MAKQHPGAREPYTAHPLSGSTRAPVPPIWRAERRSTYRLAFLRRFSSALVGRRVTRLPLVVGAGCDEGDRWLVHAAQELANFVGRTGVPLNTPSSSARHTNSTRSLFATTMTPLPARGCGPYAFLEAATCRSGVREEIQAVRESRGGPAVQQAARRSIARSGGRRSRSVEVGEPRGGQGRRCRLPRRSPNNRRDYDECDAEDRDGAARS